MNSFYLTSYDGFYFLKSKLLEKYNINHFFSTTKDTKRNINEGVNFSFRDGFTNVETIKSLEKAAIILNSSYERITKSTQVHDAVIYNIEADEIGMGISKETIISNGDGIITNIKNVPLLIYTADCVPIILADKEKTVVCAVHAGWRGTVKEILKNAIEKITNEYGVKKENILAAIGPSIGECCFQVSKEVCNEFQCIPNIDKYIEKKPNDKFNINLKMANYEILRKYGVIEENIDISKECTMCNSENLFYSYRRDGEKTGRLGAFVVI